MTRERATDEGGSALVQTTVAGSIVFAVLIPLLLQMLVLPVGDLVTLFATQGAADQLRKKPDDPTAAELRARRVVEAFGGDAFLRDVEVELSVIDGRAIAVVRGRARPVIPGVVIRMRNRATGSVEEFRPDVGTASP